MCKKLKFPFKPPKSIYTKGVTMKKIYQTMSLPKFKNRICIMWQSDSHCCIRDILTGKTKIIEIR